MTEEQFLIAMAVDKYNYQYSKSFQYGLFDIKRIPNNQNSSFAFEVFASVMNLDLRLRIYLEIRAIDGLSDYRLEVDSSDHTGELGDEVFVAFGSVDSYYIQNHIYNFNTPLIDYLGTDLLITEYEEIFAYEDGTYILLESAGA